MFFEVSFENKLKIYFHVSTFNKKNHVAPEYLSTGFFFCIGVSIVFLDSLDFHRFTFIPCPFLNP